MSGLDYNLFAAREASFWPIAAQGVRCDMSATGESRRGIRSPSVGKPTCLGAQSSVTSGTGTSPPPFRPLQCQPPIVPAKPLATAVAARDVWLARRHTVRTPPASACRSTAIRRPAKGRTVAADVSDSAARAVFIEEYPASIPPHTFIILSARTEMRFARGNASLKSRAALAVHGHLSVARFVP